MASQFIINGKVTQSDRTSLSGVTVKAFDKGLPSLGARGEQQLGDDALTDAKGYYQIIFDEEEFRANDSGRQGKLRPDLFVRVFDGNTPLCESKITFHASPETRIDLTVKVPQRSEYEALVHRLTPILQGVFIGDLTNEDLAFIKGETETDPERLKLLRLATQLARKTSLPADGFYGLGRRRFRLDTDKLVAVPDKKLIKALIEATKARIIPSQFRDQAESFVHQLKRINNVVYEAKLQLIDEKTNSNLLSYKVQVFDSNSQRKLEPLATTRTDDMGTFTFNYSTTQASSRKKLTHKFLLKITTSDGTQNPDTTVKLKVGDQEVVQVSVAVPAPEISPSPAVSKIAALLKVPIPKKLQSFLSENNIRTLADIRTAAGLSRLEGLPVARDHAALQMLEAHADLSRLSADAQVNASLIAKGYSSVAAIADTPASTFVSALRDLLGDFNAARMHVVAKAQTAFLDNVLADIAANRSSASSEAIRGELPSFGFPEYCACEDCESAISPGFYLIDLLRYAMNSIQVNGVNISLKFLVDTFHQPFEALPISCEAVNQKVPRVRVCIEILRAYLGARPLPDPQKELALEKVEREYLSAAYTTLLTQIGTSYDEIRLARTDSDDNRKALAERLGIELTIPRPSTGDELDRLFIDISTGANGPNGLERLVEQLFGLADTFRDPLSDGPKFRDEAENRITRWSLRGAEWGRNTDSDGNVYVSFLGNPDPSLFEIKVYRDSQRTQLVASSDPVDGGHIPILPENASGLSGSFDVTGGSLPPPGNDVFISAIPNFLSWRLKHLRTLWAQQDRPDDPYSDSAIPKLPLIDPDLIGPDDFRLPVATGGNTPFDLWLARRGFVDQTLHDIRAMREGPGGLTAALEQTFGKPLPDFDGLLQQLTSGSKDDVKAAQDTISKLGLTVDAFVRLMQVRNEDQQAQIDPRTQVTDDEWSDVYSILTQVSKVSLFDSWRAQEQQVKLLLGFQDFWISVRQPVEGAWPPAEIADDSRPQSVPLIDPEVQTVQNLPEAVSGQQAITLWNQRLADLKAFTAKLATTREDSGFTAMLKLALGDPFPHDLDQLRKDLSSSNPAVVSAAQEAITQDLHLTLVGFNTMMAIRDKDTQPDPVKKPTLAEYEQVYTILTRAWKLGKAYPKWISEENMLFTAEGQTAGDPLIAYWRARKALLPRWRASVEARQVWSDALLARSAPSIIDPDLIGPEDLRDPFAGNVAYDLWAKRNSDIASRVTTISQAPRTNTNLDALFNEYLSVSGGDLSGLKDARDNGQNIKSRLDQLGLSSAAFAALVKVWKLSVNNLPLVDSDWETVGSILVQVYKTRQYAQWRNEEALAQPAIILGLDLFRIPPPPADPLLAIKPRQLPAWRASQQALRAWQDILQNRIDQQATTISGIRDAVSAAEVAALEGLRDGLVLATQASGSDLDRAASWVTRRFFIDAKAGACQSTTRVEQAIETLQGLFESLAEQPFDTGVFQFARGLAATGGPGGVHVFARGADNALWHTQEIGNAWMEWESLGGELRSDPCVCIRNGNLELFALLADSAVWQKTFANGAWSDWQSLGGSWTSAPAAVSWGGDHLEIVVRGDDWAPWHRRFLNGQWADWESLSLGGAIISSAPTVTSRGVERLDIFARGTDNRLYYLSYENGFGTWVPRGGLFNSGPSAVGESGPAGASGLVFVFGEGSDDLMYFDFFADTSQAPNWLNLFPLPDGITLAAAPASFAFSRSRVDVLIRASDDRLWQGSLLLQFVAPQWSGWSVIGPPPLTLNAPGFETDWKWLGSYATWRASMLVFLYPENLLLPTLRPAAWQTPGFHTLVNTLASGGTLTSDTACQAAADYAGYFRDVCGLNVEATCHAMMPIHQAGGCDGSATAESHYAFFMFARGGFTNRIYWSVYDLEASSTPNGTDFAQSYWTEIKHDALKGVIKLIGAASSSRGILLFVHAKASDSEKLTALRLDPSSQEVSLAVDDLKPSGVTSFVAAVVQDPEVHSDREVFGGGGGPSLGIQLQDGSLYVGHLNRDCSAWAGGNPKLVGQYNYPLLALASHGELPHSIVVVPWTQRSETEPPVAPDWEVSFLPGVIENAASDSPYHGLIWIPDASDSDGSALRFFIFGDFGGSATVFTLYEGQNGTFNGFISQVDAIVPSGGRRPISIAAPDQPYQFVYLRRPDGAFRRCTFAFINDEFISNLVYIDTDNPLAPDVPDGLREITHGLSATQLQQRREDIQQAFAGNLSSPFSLRSYLEEAFYFVPMQIALQLQRSGEYETALSWFRTVYDYTAPKGDERKIYYGLKQEESIRESYVRAANWLEDPLNPHAIARTRGNTYTRFSLLSIIPCLLDYADSEFAQDTGESLARARRLYETALDLLESDELQQPLGACPSIIDGITFSGPNRTVAVQLTDLKRRLAGVSETAQLRNAVEQIRTSLTAAGSIERHLLASCRTAARAAALSARPKPLQKLLTASDDWRKSRYLSLTSAGSVQLAIENVGQAAANKFDRAVATATGLPIEQLEQTSTSFNDFASRDKPPGIAGSDGVAATSWLDLSDEVHVGYTPAAASLLGCVPPNPRLDTLRSHAELNLTKLRTCRNIAGMKREVEPYSAPITVTGVLPAIGPGGQLDLGIPATVSIEPTLYRYAVIVDRARQLVQTASQIEATMLSALEKFDEKTYGLLRARQDLNVAQATFQLNTLKVNAANDGVKLANLQTTLAQRQADHYQDLLTHDLNSDEKDAIRLLNGAARDLQTAENEVTDTTSWGLTGPTRTFNPSAEDALLGQRLSTLASMSSLQAGFERRREEWQFQEDVAQQNVEVSKQQITIAIDDVQIATAEQTIADLQQKNAQDTVAFLVNEFTNPDLYDFMSKELGRVYSFFLRQATGMAKLAENQLAFERQETPLGLIRPDYWAPPSDMQSGTTNSTADRKGLTGAERLLEDITQLDQYAFLTDKRKLQLSKTLSLGRLAPAEFQRFRETGALTFSTPMEFFDRDFPGHYLRLIKVVRISVIALIPPNQGISATLSNSGLSRVVIGGDTFQTKSIRRNPETMVFSSPIGASDVLDLTAQSGDMLLPFENTGVDTTWEFRLEKASNLFDYSTIADVLLTIEYTALNDVEYRQQVIQSLNPELITDRPFSFRNQFSDQWYDLHNPDQTPTPMTVQFATAREDFPPNFDDLSIQQVVLYFSRADGQSFEISVASLRFKEQDASGSLGGGATSIDGVISTRRGNAGSWLSMIGHSPIGDWELALPDNDEMRSHFANDDIQDILFVITYSGRTANWSP